MRACCGLLPAVVALALAAPAVAGGPVFVVVPTSPAEASEAAATAPAPAAGIQSELAADRRALAGVRRGLRRTSAAVRQAERRAASAQLLSDQLETEMRLVQLRVAEAAAVVRRGHLQERIAALERQAQPPAPAAFDPLMPLSSGSGLGSGAVSIAEQYLGLPYRWGGSDPVGGFDCSGLTMYVYAQLGIQLPHYAAAQWSEGFRIDPTSLLPGDLVFFEPRADGPGHVAIYVGGDQILEAPHTGDVVKFASFSETAAELGFVGAVRPAASYAANALR